MPNRKRNQQFAVRISETELSLFEKKRSASGLSKTDFFIKLLESSVIKVYNFNATAADIFLELRKIGVNLNQIAYHANAGFLPQAESELRNIHALYAEAMEKLMAFLECPLLNACIVESENS